ncbi:MAG: NAD(+) synthase [Metamycoplasmataceae bacterium]
MSDLKYYNYLVSWLKEEVNKAGAKGVIVGISGGIDSALVGAIAKAAFPNNSLGVIMPISSRVIDKEDGIELCKTISLDYKIVELKDEFKLLSKKLELSSDLSKANLQARLRMSTLYAIAQEKSYLVLGTDNYAEYYLGYFTKYGDGGCDLLPIVQLHKSEVYAIAKLLKLPNSIINKAPSAGLWDNQEDEKELGFSYNDFETFIKSKKVDSKVIEKINNLHKNTKHKRNPIPKPLGIDEYTK